MESMEGKKDRHKRAKLNQKYTLNDMKTQKKNQSHHKESKSAIASNIIIASDRHESRHESVPVDLLSLDAIERVPSHENIFL